MIVRSKTLVSCSETGKGLVTSLLAPCTFQAVVKIYRSIPILQIASSIERRPSLHEYLFSRFHILRNMIVFVKQVPILFIDPSLLVQTSQNIFGTFYSSSDFKHPKFLHTSSSQVKGLCLKQTSTFALSNKYPCLFGYNLSTQEPSLHASLCKVP